MLLPTRLSSSAELPSRPIRPMVRIQADPIPLSRQPQITGICASLKEKVIMKIFPAIDLRGGKAVRLFQGDYDQMTVYSNDPVKIAEEFREREKC